MMNGQAMWIPKQIKLDDYEGSHNNLLHIFESSNLLLGTGARSSNASIVLAKCLHFMQEEGGGEVQLSNKRILEIGGGCGLLSVYLCAIVAGVQIVIGDVPAMKELAQRNISMNKQLLKGRVSFATMNWKSFTCTSKCESTSTTTSVQCISTASSNSGVCVMHLLPNIDLTIICECGGLSDFQHQVKWLGKEGGIICFLQRHDSEQYLQSRAMEEWCIQHHIEYLQIETYHPDYTDERIKIYRIWAAK